MDERTTTETAFIVSIPQSQIRTKLSVQQSKTMQLKSLEISSTVQTSVTGTRKVLCILIGFTDVSFSKTQTEFDNLMNQAGYNANSATGSVRDYYSEVSYGQLNLDVTVAGPYTADNNMAYYGADSYDSEGNLISRYIRAKELVTEAIQKANPDVNYADYDSDGDGYVEGVHVIFAGYDQAAGAPTDAIWSHKSQISPIKLDNKWIKIYSCSSELRGVSGSTIATIGTACHEFGHVLGAPDFYDRNIGDVNDGDFGGTGEWDLMAHGSWNGPWGAHGSSPAHINPYTKINTFGWASVKSLPADNSLVTLYPANSVSNSFYKIPTPTSGEYFLIENRQQLELDAFIPGHGMLVWHVHKDIESDRYAINITHPQRLYPVCASATQNPTSDPASYGAINGGGCPFPGSTNQCFFNFTTTPALRSWAGASTEKDIQFITESGNNITFVANPQISGPSTVCSATFIVDNLPSNDNIIWEASPNLQIINGQGTAQITVNRISGGNATISATITTSCGGTLTLTRTFNPFISVLKEYDYQNCNNISVTATASPGASVVWETTNGLLINGMSSPRSGIGNTVTISSPYGADGEVTARNCFETSTIYFNPCVYWDANLQFVNSSSPGNPMQGEPIEAEANPCYDTDSYRWYIDGQFIEDTEEPVLTTYDWLCDEHQLQVQAVTADGVTDLWENSIDYWGLCGYFMALSPNPASDYVEVSISTESTETSQSLNDTYTVRVLNIYGFQVYHSKKKGGKFNIPVSNLKEGIYVVEASNGKKVARKQLIVKND